MIQVYLAVSTQDRVQGVSAGLPDSFEHCHSCTSSFTIPTWIFIGVFKGSNSEPFSAKAVELELFQRVNNGPKVVAMLVYLKLSKTTRYTFSSPLPNTKIQKTSSHPL